MLGWSTCRSPQREKDKHGLTRETKYAKDSFKESTMNLGVHLHLWVARQGTLRHHQVLRPH